MPPLGTKIGGRYQVTGALGSGGMGSVFAARDVRLDRQVAVKLLPPERRRDRRATERFLREAHAMTRIAHSAMVQVFDRGRDDAFGPFLVMEKMEGEDLSRYLRARGTLPQTTALALVAEICGTVQAAHDAGVFHRDLKPANIFVLRHQPGAVPHIKLIDFGVARLQGDDRLLTDPGDVLGTLAYMAPERLGAGGRSDVRADVYALGAITYEMLCGAAPFRGDTRAALRLAILNDPPLPLRQVRPSVPDWLAEVVEQALDKRPERRYSSVRSFSHALGIALPDAPAGGRADYAGTERFRVLRKIAHSVDTEIYAARDLECSGQVALKRLRSPGGEAGYRLKREFRAAAGVRHPNLVRLHALVEEGGDLLLAMELVEGPGLLEYVSGSPDRLRSCLAQLVEGLGALHARGLAHCDVKPENLVVDPSGRLVLLDCGLVSRFGSRKGANGTPAYMAPEVLEGWVGPEADFYAVGVILYLALTGRLPPETLAARPRRSLAPIRRGAPRDLSELCGRLLATEPAKRPAAAEILRVLRAGAPARPATARLARPATRRMEPFVGRDDLLATLRGALDRVASGSPLFVWLEGPSGIGKTALLDQFRRQLDDERPALVLSSGAREGESVPFPALNAAVDDLGSHLLRLPAAVCDVLLPRRCGALARLFPTLARIPAIARAAGAPGPMEEPVEVRRLASDALRELFRRLADRQPVVLLVDDMQWLDPDSAALLTHVVGGHDAPPLLVIGAVRSNDDVAALRAMERDVPCPVVRIDVPPLSQPDTCDLLRTRWRGDVPLDGQSTARLARQSGGVPFFAEMLVSAAGRPGARGATTIEDALVARHRGLPLAARRAFELLCVSSRPLRIPLVLEAAGASSNPDTLDPLFAASLIRFTRVDGEWAIEPSHGKIRESIRQSLTPAARRAAHRRLIQRLRDDPDADPEASVEHLAGIGDMKAAAEVALRAAGLANQQLAFDRAAVLFEVALESGRFTRDQRVSIGREQAQALHNAGHRRHAGQVLLSAAGWTRDVALAATLRREAGLHLLLSGDVKNGLDVLGAALKQVGLRVPAGLPETMQAASTALASLQRRGVVPALEDRVASREAYNRLDLCLDLAQGLAHIDLRALPFACQALEAALDAGEPRRLQRACALFVIISVEYMPTPLVRPALDLCRRLTSDAGEPVARALLDAAIAEHAHFESDFLSAEAAFERAERTLLESCVGATRELATVRDLAVFLQYAQKGDFKSQLARTQRWQAQADAAKDLFHASMLRVAHGIVWIAHDDPRRARAELQRAQEEGTGPASVLSVAIALYHDIIDRYEGDEVALAGSGAARPALLSSPAAETPLLSGYLGLHGAWRSLRAIADGRAPADEADTVRATVARLRGLGLEIWSAVADALEGNVDYLDGRREAALRALDRAERRFRRMHMLCLASCARKRRGQFMAGEIGGRLESEADAELRALGVVNPQRWSAAYWSMFEADGTPLRTHDGEDDSLAPEPLTGRGRDGEPSDGAGADAGAARAPLRKSARRA